MYNMLLQVVYKTSMPVAALFFHVFYFGDIDIFLTTFKLKVTLFLFWLFSILYIRIVLNP